MSQAELSQACCIIIGASHAGINAAFALRKEGWEGKIKVFDTDPNLPYHRPPLSKTYLTSNDGIEKNLIKSALSYEKNNIDLYLGKRVLSVSSEHKHIIVEGDEKHAYQKLILASGARPFMPPITGLNEANKVFALRTASDVNGIREALLNSEKKRVVVIGGGYIGLETAASMKKMGAKVTVLERENRLLARVTAPLMSEFFEKLHLDNGVDVLSGKNVESIKACSDGSNLVYSDDGDQYAADIIVVGVGIVVNTELAESASLTLQNGIKVDGTAQTSDQDIYAIGDCAYHYNPHFDTSIRLESVQNAVEQAKVAAASICGKDAQYDVIPWFWSDQFEVKLQMVGLSTGYNKIIRRDELVSSSPSDKLVHKFSVWYFKDSALLAVDSVNNAKAYVVATKLIKSRAVVNQEKLIDPEIALHPDSFV